MAAHLSRCCGDRHKRGEQREAQFCKSRWLATLTHELTSRMASIRDAPEGSVQTPWPVLALSTPIRVAGDGLVRGGHCLQSRIATSRNPDRGFARPCIPPRQGADRRFTSRTPDLTLAHSGAGAKSSRADRDRAMGMFGKLKQQRRLAICQNNSVLTFECFLNLAASELSLKSFFDAT
jgi:hypothetical protein